MTALRAALALGLVACSLPVTAAAPRFQMTAQVKGGMGVFDGIVATDLLRRFGDEVISVAIVGDLSRGDASGIDPLVLVAGLTPCIADGSIEQALLDGDPIECKEVTGLSWTISYEPGDGLLSARATAAGAGLPAGSHDLLFKLENAALANQLGPHAVRYMRSNPMKIIQGPPTTEDEALSELHAQGVKALAQGDRATAAARATSILAVHPQSALALVLRAEAREAAKDATGAIADYHSALGVLERNEDTRTPWFRIDEEREGYILLIKGALAELGEDLDP